MCSVLELCNDEGYGVDVVVYWGHASDKDQGVLYTLALACGPLGLSGERACTIQRALVMRADRGCARHRWGRAPAPRWGPPSAARVALALIDSREGASLPAALARPLVSKFWRMSFEALPQRRKPRALLLPWSFCALLLIRAFLVKDAYSSRKYGGQPSKPTA